MAMCMNPRCDGKQYLCGKCRKQFPTLAASMDKEKRSRRNNRGSTMYGRSYGSSKRPSGASGSINPRTGEGHSTQYYDDNTRLSWDTDGSGESNQHWTDQNKGKKNPGRHQPPGHAK